MMKYRVEALMGVIICQMLAGGKSCGNTGRMYSTALFGTAARLGLLMHLG